MINNTTIWLTILVEPSRIKWKLGTIVLAETLFTWVITNYKNKAGNSIINQWEGGRRDNSRLLLNNNHILRNTLQTLLIQVLMPVLVYIKKQGVLLNRGLFPDKQMLIFELKYTKIRESFITFKVRNKKTWTSCFTTLMILIKLHRVPMVVDRLLEDLARKAEEDTCLTMAHQEALRLKVECELKTTSTNQKI